MRIKLTITFLLLLPIVSVFYSCVCDVTIKYESYSHTTLQLKNLDNSGAQITETESLQINKSAYGIRLYLTREKSVVACNKQGNSIFIQSAYATSIKCPPEYMYSPKDSIVSIKIKTIKDFDNTHSENSDVTGYFRVAHFYSTIKDYVSNMYYTFGDDQEFENSWNKEIILDLLLMTAPITNNKQQFEIQVALSDGRLLKQLTTEIEML